MSQEATPDTPKGVNRRPLRRRTCTQCGASFHSRDPDAKICDDCLKKNAAAKKSSKKSQPKKEPTPPTPPASTEPTATTPPETTSAPEGTNEQTAN